MKLLSNIKQKMMCGINSISKTKLLLSSTLVAGVTILTNTVFAQSSSAPTIGGMMEGIYVILGNILKLVQYGAVVAAVILAIMGIMTLKQASTAGQQGQQGQHKAGFVKIITAVALLIAVPLLQALQVQVAGTSSISWSQDENVGTQKITTAATCRASAVATTDQADIANKLPCLCVGGMGPAKSDGTGFEKPTDENVKVSSTKECGFPSGSH